VPTASLSFLNRRASNKQVCRVCRELAELKTERLCAMCTRIKGQLRTRFPNAVRDLMTAEQQCKRSDCVCAACGGRTLDLHPLYASDPVRAESRELHFHPRCHELWLEMGLGARRDDDGDAASRWRG
jgi:hypothetical protein